MINYIEKGKYLGYAIISAGFKWEHLDGEWQSNNDSEVQVIIDTFNPLPYAQKEHINLVNVKAGETRVKHVTHIPFQEAAYQAKEADVRMYRANGYPADLTQYPFTAAEADATGLSPTDAADLVISQADQWLRLSAEIERLRRKASVLINAETDWSQVSGIADIYIQQLEAM
jgi:hypothetical protein